MGNVLSPGYTYDPTTLDLPNHKGSLKGTRIGGKVDRYLGVPYALPPTGQWRWKKPRPLPRDHVYNALDCTRFPPLSIQPRNYMPFKLGHEGQDPGVSSFSEDCLTLNIWVPTTTNASSSSSPSLPVVVWIHGGYLQIGDPASNPLEDPTELLTEKEAGGGGLQCVFVAITYRLSAMGFLASRELQEEAVSEQQGDGSWGNYGLWDQRLALEWVQENIEAFGGDPSKVTLMGRSAGAYSVHAQAAYDMLMPKSTTMTDSRPLFSRMIMYSNAIPTNPKSITDVQPQFDTLLSLLDIPSDDSLTGPEKLARLRALPAETINDAVERMTKLNTFRPVADGVFFPEDLFGELFESGRFASEFKKRGMRLMIGDVQNEETMYRVFNTPSSLEALRTQLLNYYPGPVVDTLIEDYHNGRVDLATLGEDPDPDVEELKRLYGRIASDAQIRAPTRLLLSQLEAAHVPIDHVRRYRVAWMPSFSPQLVPATMGVPHGGDTPAFNYSVMHGANERDKQVMDEWIRNLTDFVHGHDSADFGTRSYKDVKVLRQDGSVAIENDTKWDYLTEVAKRMASAGKRKQGNVEAAS